MTGAALLVLPTVTLCAATSVNHGATLAALRRCLSQVQFGDAIMFSDRLLNDLPKGLRNVCIDRMSEAADYSHFMLRALAQHIHTEHVLVVQWDGFILDPACWDPQYLNYDYIGAVWPQFGDKFRVGNGGFSLRSRRLLDACLDARFLTGHPEDVTIGRTNRAMLEAEHGIRYADEATARRFSFEREAALGPTFGFHGVFNMPRLMGEAKFWEVYQSLSDRRSVFHDAQAIASALGLRNSLALLRDYLKFKLNL
jgi:hypothetical protein